jgi:hypothetical protein
MHLLINISFKQGIACHFFRILRSSPIKVTRLPMLSHLLLMKKPGDAVPSFSKVVMNNVP